MRKQPFEDPLFFGERMRQIRLAKGYRQADVAQVLHVSRSTYSYYETGAVRPDPLVFGRLALFYHVPVCCFFKEGPICGMPPACDRSAIGQLTPAERALIVFLRGNLELDVKVLLRDLEKRVKLIREAERE